MNITYKRRPRYTDHFGGRDVVERARIQFSANWRSNIILTTTIPRS